MQSSNSESFTPGLNVSLDQQTPQAPSHTQQSFLTASPVKKENAKNRKQNSITKEFILTNFPGNSLTAYRKVYTSYEPVLSPVKQDRENKSGISSFKDTPNSRFNVSRTLNFSSSSSKRPRVKNKKIEALRASLSHTCQSETSVNGRASSASQQKGRLKTEPDQNEEKWICEFGQTRKPHCKIPSILSKIKEMAEQKVVVDRERHKGRHWLEMVKNPGGDHGRTGAQAKQTLEKEKEDREEKEVRKSLGFIKLKRKEVGRQEDEGKQKSGGTSHEVKKAIISLGKRYGGLYK